MERYYKRKLKLEVSPPRKKDDDSSKQIGLEINSAHLPANSGLQHPAETQNCKDQDDQICKANLQRGPYQDSGYQKCLKVAIGCILYLHKQGLVFNEFEEFCESSYLEFSDQLLQLVTRNNDDLEAVVLKNIPENLKFTTLDFHKDIVRAAATEISNSVTKDLGDAPFSVFLEESYDMSTMEQMAVVLRYVDKKGHVIERFLGIEQLANVNSLSFKASLESCFSRHGLNLSRLRGLGFDGTTGMNDAFNGLKKLIIQENECAYRVHCFTHELHTTLVNVAKDHYQIYKFCKSVSGVVKAVTARCKNRDILLDKQQTEVIEALNAELPSWLSLNEEPNLKRSSDTTCSSYYGTLIGLINMFSSVMDVLERIEDDGLYSAERGQAYGLSDIYSFEFVFTLHLMKSILEATNEFSQTLMRKDQDIPIAMTLAQASKERLRMMRESGWCSMFDDVSSFCGRHDIVVPNMNEIFPTPSWEKHKDPKVTNLHYFRAEVFYAVIDMCLKELDSRFTESNIELLLCVGCLSPSDLFSAFDKQKLNRLAQFYPKEFSSKELMTLNDQLGAYIIDMRSASEFSKLKSISDLAQKLVEYGRDKVYPLVYLLVTLALILPISSATVERAISAMKTVKKQLLSQTGDRWINDSLVLYIEQDILEGIDNEVIMHRFHNMESCSGEL